MTPDLENLEQRIDRDRREREDEILLLLLLLFGWVYVHMRASIRIGSNPLIAAQSVLMGNPSLGLPGLPSMLAPSLLTAGYAGYRRTVLAFPPVVTPGRPPVAMPPLLPPGIPSGGPQAGLPGAPGSVPPAPIGGQPTIPGTRGGPTVTALNGMPYPARLAAAQAAGFVPPVNPQQRAYQAASQMLATLGRRASQAIGAATGTSALQALRMAWRKWGYTNLGGKPVTLRTAAEVLVGEAYQAGYVAGLSRPEVRAVLMGFRFSATLDAGTTAICRARDGVKLRADDPWFARNWPMLHFGCRSIILPLTRPFVPTLSPPQLPPPEPGFGVAPATSIYGLQMRQAG